MNIQAKSFKKSLMLILVALMLAMAAVIPAAAADYPDDGDYTIEYVVLHATTNAVSMLDAYRDSSFYDGNALLTVSNNGTTQTVTVKFTDASSITEFEVDLGDGYEAADVVDAVNRIYSFELDDLSSLLNVRVHIVIPGPLPGFPDGYDVWREARFSFNEATIVEA